MRKRVCMNSIINKIFINSLSLGIFFIDFEYKITVFNDWLKKHSGLHEDDVLGISLFDVFPEIAIRGKEHYIIDCIEQDRSAMLSPLIHQYLLDLKIVKGGHRIQMIQEVRLFPMSKDGENPGGVIVIKDFTEQIRHEKALVEKSKTLKAVRKINRMMVRTNSEDILFSESIKILTRDINAPFVWFTKIEKQSKQPVLAGFGGSEADLFKRIIQRDNNLHLTLKITRKALQTGETQVCYRRDNEPNCKKWWDLFRHFQCQSVIAIPLRTADTVSGVLHIHRHESQSIPPEITELFQELADDIAFTLKNFDDISKRKQAELETAAEKERLLVTLKGIGDGVLVADKKGNITLMNSVAEKLIGWPENEAVGRLVSDVFNIVNEFTRKPHDNPVEKVIRSGKVVSLANHTILLSKDGSEYIIIVSAAPIIDNGGSIIGVVLVFKDVTEEKKLEGELRAAKEAAESVNIELIREITDRKRAEQKLYEYSVSLEERVEERTEELKKTQDELLLKERLAVLGHFAGSISHEIRNPLAVIDSSAYFLKMKLGNSDEKIDRHLEFISRNVSKSTVIIESLLNLTRMEKPKTETHDLSDLLPDMIKHAKIPGTVEMILNLPDKKIYVDIDSEQIRMALKNIMRNAVQAMNGAGKLTISILIVEPGQAKIAVADTGPGIAPDYLEKIFEPLFSTKTHGIGFGLSITKMIFENHGGKVKAISNPGGGATLIFTLPISEKERYK